jgi:hypothetical protein
MHPYGTATGIAMVVALGTVILLALRKHLEDVGLFLQPMTEPPPARKR